MSGSQSFARVIRFAAAGLCAVTLFLAGCGKPTPPEMLEEALGLLQQGQTARAVLKLKEVTREHGDDPAAQQAHLLLARYYAQEGNGTRAIEELESVLATGDMTDPAVLDAANGLITIRLQLDDFEEALKVVDKLLEGMESERERELKQVERAQILLAWGQITPEKTEEGENLIRGLMLDSEEAYVRGVAREQLANYFRRTNQLEECNAVYEEYLEAHPDETVRPRLEMAMAVNLKKLDRTEEADALFEPAIETVLGEADLEPDTQTKTKILEEAAQLYEAYGDYEKTDEVRRLIMGENKMSQIAISNQFQLANMWAVAGIREKSEEHFNRGLAEFEKIAADNSETSIGETARTSIESARKAFDEAMNPPEEPDAEQVEDAETSPVEEKPAE